MTKTLEDKFDSIIFDLDGTLWDSTVSVAHAWTEARACVDFVKEDITPEQIASIAGMAYDAIYDKLFPYLDFEDRKHFRQICARKELEVLAEKGGELYPEVESTLDYLSKRYRLFIVSNCQTGYIEIFLRLNNLEKYFDGHQCYGTKNRPKADNIRDIVEEFKLISPVYVGDTEGDFQSSQKAGVPFIFADFGFGTVERGPVATLYKFSDLTQIL